MSLSHDLTRRSARASLVAFVVIAVGVPRAAAAEDAERPPLPESLLTESATDLDAEAGGEVEFEANFASARARSGGARATTASVEVEWRVLRSFGLRLEPSYAREVSVERPGGRTRFGVGGALAFGLFHDFPRDMHLQLELLGRTPDDGRVRFFEPSETALPVAADLVGALRRGRWTLRSTIGAEAGDAFAHAPVHTDLALLTGFHREERFGFMVLEARADWARSAPLVLAPEVVADLTPLGGPFRLGLALPVNVGASRTETSYGLFVRVILLTGRETEYGRTGKTAEP